jgi:hypothetical protein
VRNHHELGECRSPQESVVHRLDVGNHKLQVFCAKVFLGPKVFGPMGVTATLGTMSWNRARLGHNADLDNPIWQIVFKNRMFRELPHSRRTQLSFTSLTLGLTMRGYCLSFCTKFEWSLQLKLMGTSDHLRYSGVAGETAMTSRAVSFYFLLDSYESGAPYTLLTSL